MRRLFNQWLNTGVEIHDMSFGEICIKFSKWLSGVKEDGNRRFMSNYRPNKFMVRKWLSY